MQELIKIEPMEIGVEYVNTVNSRELHAALEVNRDYSNWMKSQIDTLGLEKNVDYILLAQNGEQKNGRGGHNAKDYIITTDTAKHIAMASRTPKGKEVRNYFIEVEKRYNGYNDFAHDLGEAESRVEIWREKYYAELEKNNELLMEKVERLESIVEKPATTRTPFCEEEILTIVEMRKSGSSLSQIASELGRHQGSISAKVAELKRCGKVNL